MSGLRQTPMYRSLVRDQLLLGCDRTLLIPVSMVSLLMPIMAMNLIGVISALVFFSLCLYLLRRMGAADPKMLQVYLRHIDYQEYYPVAARPRRDSKHKRVY